jgi:hypothetical protein
MTSSRTIPRFGAALLAASIPALATDEPAFRSVEKQGDMEIRIYAPMIVAETLVEGDMDQASSQGFRLLADYIFGNNRSRTGSTNAKIAMTSPVTMQPSRERIAMTAPVGLEARDGQWRVHFVMPASYTMETLPVPNDARVSLRELPEQKVAAVVFSGMAGEAKVNAKTKAILAWMDERGLKPAASPQLARYNPPWTLPSFRRNEILVPLR